MKTGLPYAVLLAMALIIPLVGCTMRSSTCRDQHDYQSLALLGESWQASPVDERCRYLDAILGQPFVHSKNDYDLSLSLLHGMTQAEVIRVLGPPDASGDSYLYYKLDQYVRYKGPYGRYAARTGGLFWNDPTAKDVLMFRFYSQDGRLSEMLVGS